MLQMHFENMIESIKND